MTTSLRRSTTAVATAFALAASIAVPTTVHAAPPRPITIPVGGNIAGGGTFNGVMTVSSFAVQDHQVMAMGTLSGILTNAQGAVLGSVVTPVALPATVPPPGASPFAAAAAAGTCAILHLDLGPLNLSLLGLNVDLSQVVLDITATSGAGNL